MTFICTNTDLMDFIFYFKTKIVNVIWLKLSYYLFEYKVEATKKIDECKKQFGIKKKK